MRYLLLLYGEPVRPETLTPEQWQAVVEAHGTFHHELTEAGALVDSSPLAPPGEARTLRTRGGEQLVVDGPFAETKEALGGFYLVNARDLDEAIELAARIPAATHGSIEVRPIFDFDGAAPAASDSGGASR
jgi:hypothetical protein